MATHVRSLIGNHVIDVASSDQHTIKPWLNVRVDIAPPVTDLTEKRRCRATTSGNGRRADYASARARLLGGLGFWAICDLNAVDLTTFERLVRGAGS